MIKRFIGLFLVLLSICSLLAACGQTTPTDTKESGSAVNIMQKSDPSKDDSLNILMIGNSFCFYYVEELYGMLTAAGYKNVNVCNMYYSGCTLDMHWE